MVAWLANLRNRSLPVRLAVLVLAVLAVYALAAPVAVQWGGAQGLAAAAVAAGLCLAGAAAAIVTTRRLRGDCSNSRVNENGTVPFKAPLLALWLGMALRMGIPLAVGLTLHLHGGMLAQAGLLWYLLLFYPVTLIAGTIVSLPPTNQHSPHKP
jgi:hypothetical protein